MPATPLIGQVRLFGGNFAPRGWAFCHGQLLPINQFDALFAIIGTTYGGDGRTTFALPDLRGRAPVGFDQGPGLSDYRIGQQGGVEQVTLLPQHLPRHSHLLHGEGGLGVSPSPAGGGLASTEADAYKAGGNVFLSSQALSNEGGGQPHNNLSPTLALNYIIALEGVFPSRN